MGKRGFISANNALFVSVDLIGEKNQVILEYGILSGLNKVAVKYLSDYTCNVMEDWQQTTFMTMFDILQYW